VVDAVNNTVTMTIPLGFDNTLPFGVAVAPDGTKTYVADAGARAVAGVNTATKTVANAIPFPPLEQPSGLAISPDGTKVYISTVQGTLIVIDAGTNSIIADTIITPNPFFGFASPGVAVSPDGGRIYVANDNLAVIDAATAKVIAMIPVGD